MDNMCKPLLSRTEVAGILGISTQSVARLIARGELPAKRVGRLVRIPAESLSEYISVNKKGGAND